MEDYQIRFITSMEQRVGAQIGVIMVLHTWGQNLCFHRLLFIPLCTDGSDRSRPHREDLALVLPATMVVVITVFTLYGGGLSPPNSAEPLNCFQLAPFI